MSITYLTGDATYPSRTPALIMHVCNDIGGWGRGFVLALSKRWKEPEAHYRKTFGGGPPVNINILGCVQFVNVASDIVVANIIAQRGVRPDQHGRPPIRYEALFAGLEKAAKWCNAAEWEDCPDCPFDRGGPCHCYAAYGPTGGRRRKGGPNAPQYTIHAPRLGCGLAGGSWEIVEGLILDALPEREVFIYDLPEKST